MNETFYRTKGGRLSCELKRVWERCVYLLLAHIYNTVYRHRILLTLSFYVFFSQWYRNEILNAKYWNHVLIDVNEFTYLWAYKISILYYYLLYSTEK